MWTPFKDAPKNGTPLLVVGHDTRPAAHNGFRENRVFAVFTWSDETSEWKTDSPHVDPVYFASIWSLVPYPPGI